MKMRKNDIYKRYSIYLIDADEQFCINLKDCLSDLDNSIFLGYSTSSSDASNFIDKECPDIIVLDCCNPKDIRSTEILEKINKNHPYNPHILGFCSAGNDEEVQRLASLGIGTFCARPYGIECISIKVNNTIKQLIKKDSSSSTNDISIVSPKHNVYLNEVTLILRKISMPPHIKGYHYFRQAIVSVIENPSKLDNIMEEIYTPIAIKYDTTVNNVERIMRHAVEASWNRCKVSVIAEVFGNTLNANKDKPSNRELIAMLADKIRMKHGLIY
jgi:two-component system response regulator (stage 0 sporulation protein A)